MDWLPSTSTLVVTLAMGCVVLAICLQARTDQMIERHRREMRRRSCV